MSDRILETTASAIKNHEQLIGTAQKNIVNANDPNYIRQNANLILDPQVGAKIESIDLVVNEMLLKAEYQKNFEHSNLILQNSYLERIIDLFGTPKLYHDRNKGVNLSPNLSGALQSFFNSLNDLQLSSNDSPDMANAVDATKNVAEKVSKLAENLQKLRQEVDGQIAESVNELNEHLKTLKSLSDKLPLLKDNDAQYNDAKTKIVNEIREVSKIVDVKQHYDTQSSLILETGNGVTLIRSDIEYNVKFDHTNNLENYLDKDFEFPALSVVNTNIASDDPQYRTDIVTSGVPDKIVHHLKGGELLALFELRDQLIPGIVKNLDQFTDNFVNEANDVYADAVPSTGFQSMLSAETFKENDKIYVNDGKFKIAFLDPNTSEVIQNSGSALSMLEFDLGSLKKNDQVTAKELIEAINQKFNTNPYSNYKITAKLVDADGKAVASGQKGYLRLKANNASFNFAIVDESTNLNTDQKAFNESNSSGKLKGINQFFGFNKLFTHVTGQFYDAESGANSAMSVKVSENVINENKLATAKLSVTSNTKYEVGKNNKDTLKGLLQLKSKKLEFIGAGKATKFTDTLSHFANNILLTLNNKNHSTVQKLGISKIELDGISEQIASQSGVNTDEELLNITQYERIYLSTLKVFQAFDEYWRQFLNQVN